MKEFEKNRQVIVDIVSQIISTRRGEGHRRAEEEELPFIDSMLQNYSSEEKVSV